MKKSTLVYFGILLVVLLVLASNTRGLIEKPETKIDKKILDELEEKSEVLVIVSLKEPNLTDKEVKEIKTKKQIYKQKQDEVLSTLSLKDFKTKNIYTLSPGFSGYITKSGLEKLKIDPNVNNIHLSRKGEYILESTVPLINADDVWKLQKDGVNITGSTQSVCIIDSGIDFSHPDFSDCNQTKQYQMILWVMELLWPA
ncbi:hypothetical protein HYU17_02520 [Candidatus Woesearchaeota archaeon]|nr:hypothetical protein [Candidatus Woesearchaeota archaeon]